MNLINREAGETFLIIREKYVSLCNGNVVAAALIHIFEQWHKVKLRNLDQLRDQNLLDDYKPGSRGITEKCYQWHTTPQLEAYLMGVGKKDSILAARRQLVSMGIITEHRNPISTFDNTTFFIFHADQLNALLEIRKPLEEKLQKPIENRQSVKADTLEENRHNTNTLSIDSNKEFIVDRRSTDKAPGPKKVKRPTSSEVDLQWAKWVDAWFVFFKSRNDGREPIFNGAQSKALKDLRKYLIKISIDDRVDQDTDEAGLMALQAIFASWDKLDDWQRSVFDLTVILKKINEFINRIKNGASENRITDQAKSGISKSREQALRDY